MFMIIPFWISSWKHFYRNKQNFKYCRRDSEKIKSCHKIYACISVLTEISKSKWKATAKFFPGAYCRTPPFSGKALPVKKLLVNKSISLHNRS